MRVRVKVIVKVKSPQRFLRFSLDDGPGPKDFREVALWGCKYICEPLSVSTRKRTSR